MKKVTVLSFGIATDIVGKRSIEWEAAPADNIGALREALAQRFPGLQNLVSLRIAVNDEYVSDDFIFQAGDEIILIPPVSGG